MKVGYLAGMDVSASGLAAQRTLMNTVAENLANAQTTKTETGEPYRRKVVEFSTQAASFPAPPPMPGGPADLITSDPGHLESAPAQAGRPVQANEVEARVVEDASEFPQVYDPGHPDADGEGMVRMPNVETTREMVTLLAASRAYEANVAALQAARKLAEASLNLAR